VDLNVGVVAIGVIYVVTSVIALAVIWWQLDRHGMRPRIEISREHGWPLAVAGLPAGISNFFGAALARIDALLLSLFTTQATVGLYGAAYRLLDSTLFLTWSFGLAIFPVLSRLDRETTPTIATAFEMACKAITALLLPIGVAIALFGPVVVKTLYGDEFAGASTAARLLGGTILLYGLYALGCFTVAAQDSQRWILWVSGPGLVLNVALNLALIPAMSLDGAALAMTITQLIMSAAMVAASVRVVGSVSASRIALGPCIGALGMGAAALLLGTGGAGLLVALGAYLPLLLLAERLFHPGDFMLLRSFARTSPAAEAEAEAAAGTV
jgi:O-antigen/teichoic acid export membrane protein